MPASPRDPIGMKDLRGQMHRDTPFVHFGRRLVTPSTVQIRHELRAIALL